MSFLLVCYGILSAIMNTPIAPEISSSGTEIFSVPVFFFEYENAISLNDELKRTILEMREKEDSETRSIRGGGWQSRKTLFASSDAPFRSLRSFIFDSYESILLNLYGLDSFDPQRIRTEAWANVNPVGGHHGSHIHLGGYHWSGAYYVAIPSSSEDDGCLVFENKIYWKAEEGRVENHWRVPLARNGLKTEHREKRISPREGLLVIFPTSLFHRVTEFRGEGERISIGFNIADPELLLIPESAPANMGARSKLTDWVIHNFWGLYAPYARLKRRLTGSTKPLHR